MLRSACSRRFSRTFGERDLALRLDPWFSLAEICRVSHSTDHSSKAKAHMIDIMSILIEESEEIPQVTYHLQLCSL